MNVNLVTFKYILPSCRPALCVTSVMPTKPMQGKTCNIIFLTACAVICVCSAHQSHFKLRYAAPHFHSPVLKGNLGFNSLGFDAV